MGTAPLGSGPRRRLRRPIWSSGSFSSFQEQLNTVAEETDIQKNCLLLFSLLIGSSKQPPHACSKCTSYPKVMAMTVMSKPKKASSFLRPAEEETSVFIHRLPENSQAEQPTVFVQEEEEESVDDGDEDSAPQRDPARKDTFSPRGLSRAPGAPQRSPGLRLTLICCHRFCIFPFTRIRVREPSEGGRFHHPFLQYVTITFLPPSANPLLIKAEHLTTAPAG